MTVLNFPASPTTGDTYTENNVTYTWNGSYWDANNTGSLDNIYVEVAGDSMTGNLLLPGGGGDTAALQKQEIELLIDAAGGGGTGPADLYWERAAGTLSPKVSTDNVNIGDGNILLNADGKINAKVEVNVGNGGSYASLYAEGQMWTTHNLLDRDLIITTKKTGGLENFAVYGDGGVGIGPDVANLDTNVISLNADGSSNFKGDMSVDNYVLVGTQGSAAGKQGVYLWAGDDGANKNGQCKLYSNSSDGTSVLTIASAPDKLTAKTTKFKVGNDGKVSIGPDASSAGTTTVTLDPVDGIKVGGVIPTAPNIQLNATSGDINTTGQVYSGLYDNKGLIRSNRTSDPNNLAFVVDGAAAGDSRTFGVFGNGTVYVGGDFSGAEPNIRLYPGGSAEYKGAATYYDFDLSATTNFGVKIQAGLVSVQRESGNEDSAFIAYQGNIQTATITADGRATFKKQLVVNTQGPGVPGVVLNDDGTIECGSNTSANSLAIKSAAVGGTNYAITSEAAGVTSFRVDSNGTITLSDLTGSNTRLYPDGKSQFKSNMTVELGRVGSPSDAALALQGSGGDFFATRYTNTDMCVVSSNSSGNNISWRASNSAVLMRLDDSGNLYTLGGVNTRRLVLNLEADDATKYTKTMGDGGIEHTVYNGATLDVKESIETATAARQAMRETFQELRTAVQSATDFSQLKAAMLVALEDYAA